MAAALAEKAKPDEPEADVDDGPEPTHVGKGAVGAAGSSEGSGSLETFAATDVGISVSVDGYTCSGVVKYAAPFHSISLDFPSVWLG